MKLEYLTQEALEPIATTAITLEAVQNATKERADLAHHVVGILQRDFPIVREVARRNPNLWGPPSQKAVRRALIDLAVQVIKQAKMRNWSPYKGDPREVREVARSLLWREGKEGIGMVGRG